jgi:hypothetical protein
MASTQHQNLEQDRSQTPASPSLPANVLDAAGRFRAGEDAELAYHLQNQGQNLFHCWFCPLSNKNNLS